jgi:hypothetical protein
MKEEVIVAYSTVISQHLPGWTLESHETSHLDNRTRGIPNTKQES